MVRRWMTDRPVRAVPEVAAAFAYPQLKTTTNILHSEPLAAPECMLPPSPRVARLHAISMDSEIADASRNDRAAYPGRPSTCTCARKWQASCAAAVAHAVLYVSRVVVGL